MAFNLDKCEQKANEISEQFNPTGISPFPFENIQKEYEGLRILIGDTPDGVSGAIIYKKEGDKNIFTILANSKEPKTRQHFTVAHELGHFFLHQDQLKKEHVLVDSEVNNGESRMLFRSDVPQPGVRDIEKEANNFAANLIMPSKLVIRAWKTIGDIQECANVFNVSPSAMTVRLEKLGLIKVF